MKFRIFDKTKTNWRVLSHRNRCYFKTGPLICPQGACRLSTQYQNLEHLGMELEYINPHAVIYFSSLCVTRPQYMLMPFYHFISLQELLWRYKFSQLKGSCDNGDTQVTFSFQNRATNNLDKQVCTLLVSLLLQYTPPYPNIKTPRNFVRRSLRIRKFG